MHLDHVDSSDSSPHNHFGPDTLSLRTYFDFAGCGIKHSKIKHSITDETRTMGSTQSKRFPQAGAVVTGLTSWMTTSRKRKSDDDTDHAEDSFEEATPTDYRGDGSPLKRQKVLEDEFEEDGEDERTGGGVEHAGDCIGGDDIVEEESTNEEHGDKGDQGVVKLGSNCADTYQTFRPIQQECVRSRLNHLLFGAKRGRIFSYFTK